MAGVLLRSARPDDVGAVLALWRAAEAEESVTDHPRAVARLVAHQPAALIVAEENGAVVGTLIAAWDGWRGAMYRLAVAPEHRRRGVATALVREGEKRLRARGAERIAAIVVTDQEQAMAFWRAAGYQVRDQQLRFVKNT